MRGKRTIGLLVIVFAAAVAVATGAQKAPLNLAIVWHQHQPMYWNRLTSEYELPWVRVHGVQEYIDSARISAEYPNVHVTFNLQPSLLWQLEDYATITAEEAALGGLYDYIGATDNHLHWIWTLATTPEELAADDRADLQEQAFWLNGYMFDNDADDPYYDPRYAQLNTLHNQRSLTDAELLDAAALFLLWQVSPELHEELGLTEYRSHSGFTAEDIVALIQAQTAVLREVISAYRAIADLGNELITSPFYHPILPLLADQGWDNDILGQLAAGQHQHEQLFGTPATGVWSPEQAVSEASVALLGDGGFAWTSADEGILAQALGHSPTIAELTRPYCWSEVALFFRETELSNRIGFAYGNKPTAEAVADFMGELETVWNGIDDPTSHVLTLAMDGENWMFMAGYPNNGRTFLRSLYDALDTAEWVTTTTPAQRLSSGMVTVRLDQLPTGSWAGDLATWSGEPDEDIAWERLAIARDVVREAGDPAEALEAIHAAQGSDWFWWYGTDQDSGTDDLYDWLFKAHLTGAYTQAGSAQIPEVLSLRLTPPVTQDLGEINPVIDGASTPEEGWEDAVEFVGEAALRSARVAFSESVLYVRVDSTLDPAAWFGEEIYLSLYASGAPGTPVNVTTRHSGVQLGFELASAIQINFSKIGTDGAGVVSKYAADGVGGWSYASSIRTMNSRRVKIGEWIEFAVPFSELGVEPGKALTIALVLERSGEAIDILPETPVLARVPTLLQGVERFVATDPVGDDHGTGTYTYPLNSIFDTVGLFDLLAYRVYDAEDRWQLAFDFAALPNPWNGPQGFSHPLLYLYFDVSDGGLIESHPEGDAARVEFDPEHPWDVFMRIAGWPAYGRHLWTASGEGPYLVEVASDPKRGRIIVTIDKSLIPEISGWHYVLATSQDGYGADYARAIGAEASEWAGGGNPEPFWAPSIYEYLDSSEATQDKILLTYSKEKEHFAVLTPRHVILDIP